MSDRAAMLCSCRTAERGTAFRAATKNVIKRKKTKKKRLSNFETKLGCYDDDLLTTLDEEGVGWLIDTTYRQKHCMHLRCPIKTTLSVILKGACIIIKVLRPQQPQSHSQMRVRSESIEVHLAMVVFISQKQTIAYYWSCTDQCLSEEVFSFFNN